MADVKRLRRNQPPAGFDTCMRTLRRFAHSRGLVVAGPCRLLGAERTGYGDSDKMEEGPVSYRLINSELLFEGLWIPKKVRGGLEEIADVLLEMSEVDIKDCFGQGGRLDMLDDERGRWTLKNARGHDIGIVVRTGEGSGKRYMLHLWDGVWYLSVGAPPYDLPVFGLPGLGSSPHKPVMIHEGPKAWQGACAAADPMVSPGSLSNWMSLYCHIGWHGADAGIEWTDWSVLRGRRVLIWSDMDDSGVATARMLGARLARMGGIVEYISWGTQDIEASESWDWADPMSPAISRLTRYDIRERIQQIECPFDVEGNVHPAWAKRSFVDEVRGEVYQAGDRYSAIPLTSMNTKHGQGSARAILNAQVNPYCGRTFRPGLPFGRMSDGRINTCPPNAREPIMGAPLPLSMYRKYCQGWLKKMVPDREQRKHLLRKAAWAIIKPEKVSQHMVVLKGESGIGKSVFMDVVCAVAGKDRAGAVYPDSIFKSFNDSIKDKCIVCIHEIHSNDITRKQNASRLKELVGNTHITIREKYRSDETRDNVIHWFGATNERVPFAMEAGNDRFYFVECVAAQDKRDKRKRDQFFRENIPELMDSYTLDLMYSAAKRLIATFTPRTIAGLVGRAKRQSAWQVIERGSLRPWEQMLLQELATLEEMAGGREQPLVFYGEEIVRLILKDFKSKIGPDDIRSRMGEFGFMRLRYRTGSPASRRINGKQVALWIRAKDEPYFHRLDEYGTLIVDSTFDHREQGD